MGKSTLLAAARRRASGRGMQVVQVTATEGSAGHAFSLVDDLERISGRQPSLGDGVADRGDALLAELTRRALDGPVLVVVDDAHFADASSLIALAVAAERADQLPVGVIVALAGDGGPGERFASWPHLYLSPLTREASLTVLRAAAGPNLPQPAVSIVDAFGGNPCALTEAPRLLTPDQICGRDALPSIMPVPAALQHAWSGRLDGLSAGGQRAVVDVAIAGARSDVLAAMASATGWQDADLDELVEAGLAVRDPTGGPPRLTTVVRDVVLARTRGATVRDGHRRAAEAAEALDLPPRIVIDHLVQSVLTANAGVAAALQRQGERAEASDHLRMASDAWQAAARLSVTPAERVDRALHAARLIISNGLDYADVDDLVELLAGAELDEESACWVDWLRALQRSHTDPDAALTAQWSTIVRARASSPHTVLMFLWDAAMNAWTLGNVVEGLRAAREYAELERRLEPTLEGVEPPWAGTALVAAGLFQAGQVAEALPLRAAAIAAAAGVDPAAEPFDRLLSMVFLDDVLLDTSAASGDRAVAALQRMVDESAPLACLYGIQAWRARASGDWPAARDLLAVGRPVAVTTCATGVQLGMAALAAELAGMAGDDDVLLEESTALRDAAMRQRDRRRLATLDRALGLRALADGRREPAIASLSAAADSPFLGRGLRDGVLPARVDLVEALARSGDLEAAAVRGEEVRAHLLAMRDPAADALSARVAALVSAGDEAAGWYEAAVAAHEAAPDPFEHGRTLLLQGEHLRRMRRRTHARAALLQAERAFDRLGARPWLARTRTELRAAGGQPEEAEGLDVLTPQETAVATAVAEGRSNREVAELLFLSPKTVEYHLGSVYRKLGVHGRGALARRMMEDAKRTSVS